MSGWLEKIRAYSDDNVKIALIANKKDLVDNNTETQQLFQDIIQDTEEGDPEDNVTVNPKSDRAGFRIESMQYEGGEDDEPFNPEKYK